MRLRPFLTLDLYASTHLKYTTKAADYLYGYGTFNQLQDVHISCKVFMYADSQGKSTKRYFKEQFFHHNTGGISRQHMVAFMLDPLRNIRLSLGGKLTLGCSWGHGSDCEYFDLSVFNQVGHLF